MGWDLRFHFVSDIYYIYIEIIHRYFKIILKVVFKLCKHLIKHPKNMVLVEIMNNQRFYFYFKIWE
jgi:hypothetical protein